MEQQQPESSAGEMMVFGLIEQADRMGKSAQGTQRALTEQIQELAQLQEWTANAAVELQKRADAAIKSLEAERVRLQGTHVQRQLLFRFDDSYFSLRTTSTAINC
jgi:hypothetical protein